MVHQHEVCAQHCSAVGVYTKLCWPHNLDSFVRSCGMEQLMLFQPFALSLFTMSDTLAARFAHEALLLLQFDDQGIVNTDARTIAVPDSYVNIIPTDVRGITFSRTPQMNINILTLGNPDGVGVFFPNGLIGAISKPTGFNVTASGTDDFPSSPMVAFQVCHADSSLGASNAVAASIMSGIGLLSCHMHICVFGSK